MALKNATKKNVPHPNVQCSKDGLYRSGTEMNSLSAYNIIKQNIEIIDLFIKTLKK